MNGASERDGSRLRALVRGSAAYAPIRRRRLDQLTRAPGTYPDWRRLLKDCDKDWREALIAAREGPRVLIATSLGLHFTANAVDSLMAVALTFRGARVEFLLCDGALPACQMVEHSLAPSVARYAKVGPAADFCDVCFPAGLRNFAPIGLPVRRFSDDLGAADREEARAYGESAARNLNPVGDREVEQGYAGALRFFGRATLADDGYSRPVLARYLAAARLAERAASRLFERVRYDAVIAHHGIYVPQGQIAAAARKAGARLVTWHPSYRAGRVIFEHGDTYHRSMIDEPKARWNRPLTAVDETELDAYLGSRAAGDQDWITFQREGPQARTELETALGLSFEKPTMILLGNVAWDARLHYKSSAYGEMTAWAADTARWFAAHPDRQLIVRCHPGEVMSSPRAQDRLDDIVRRAVPDLPKNIAIVPPESGLNTYALAVHCRSALIYNTKMGVELAARGMPVAVAGDAWIRGKGFSEDASSPAEHAAILARGHHLAPLQGERLDLARRYAFHFFFRRCIPVGALDIEKGWPLCSLAADAAERAKPGADAGLDAICAGVLTGSPFEYETPAESQAQAAE